MNGIHVTPHLTKPCHLFLVKYCELFISKIFICVRIHYQDKVQTYIYEDIIIYLTFIIYIYVYAFNIKSIICHIT